MKVPIPRVQIVRWEDQKQAQDNYHDTIGQTTVVFLFNTVHAATDFRDNIHETQGHWSLGEYEPDNRRFLDDLHIWHSQGYLIAANPSHRKDPAANLVFPEAVIRAIQSSETEVETLPPKE